MFFEMILGHFARGTAAGLGQAFAQRFLPWMASCWNWMWSSRAAAPNLEETLLRQVTIKDLGSGIPAGFQLCRFQGAKLVEKYAGDPPKSIGAEESLWLVPADSVVVATDFSAGDTTTTAEVAVEFHPEEGLASLLTAGQDLNRHWLEGLVAAGMLGLGATLGRLAAMAFVKGDRAATENLREQLNSAFKSRGLQVKSVRAIPAGNDAVAESPASHATVPAELATEIEKLRTPEEWDQLVQSLRSGGMPIDTRTSTQLDELRDRVLARTIEPNHAVQGLARMTADAFQRAGIGQPDLQRWQTISDRLADINPASPEESAVAPTPAAVGVATSKRPSTWLVWNRTDVDARQLRYTRQSIRHCRSACDQALNVLRDMPSLRQVRDLNEQLKLIEELLATVPPLESKTASLRLDAQAVKSLLKSLEDAVLTTERLAKEVDLLLAQSPGSADWQHALQSCLQSTSRLSQLVRDRRAIRG